MQRLVSRDMVGGLRDVHWCSGLEKGGFSLTSSGHFAFKYVLRRKCYTCESEIFNIQYYVYINVVLKNPRDIALAESVRPRKKEVR